MRGLLMRLSEVDSTAEAAMKVVATFDTLMQHHASVDAVLRTTAALAQCKVGMSDQEQSVVTLVGPDGRAISQDFNDKILISVLHQEVVADGEVIALVWLERNAGPEVYDELILERLSLTLAAIRLEGKPAWDTAQLETVISDEADETSRSAALNRMGLTPDTKVRVVAFSSATASDFMPDARMRADVIRSLGVHGSSSAIIGRMGVVIQKSSKVFPKQVPGTILGVGPVCQAFDLPVSKKDAFDAVRLARVLPILIGSLADSSELGSMLLLAGISREQSLQNRDVRALREYAVTGHQDDLVALEAFLRAGNLRGAGQLLHRHHSSVAVRLTHIQTAMGIDLNEPQGIYRAQTALTLFRLHG